MPRGVRFSPEQKQKMKVRALQLLKEGKTQHQVAADLKTTVTTVRAILKDVNYPGRLKPRKAAAAKPAKAAKAAKPAKAAASSASKGNLLIDLAGKQQRMEQLEKEQAALQAEMKAVYIKLGEQLFGIK